MENYMEENALKAAAIVSMLLAAGLFLLFPMFPKLHTREVEAREARIAEEEFAAKQTMAKAKMQDLEIREEISAGNESGGQLSLRLPKGVDGSRIQITNDYVTQTVRVEIPETDAAYFASYPIAGSSNHIDDMFYRQEGTTGIIELAMDKVYELDTEYDEEHYFFNFLTPREVYDKVVVIDAGHGGRAPGATKKGVKEKDIDLAIVLQLKQIFEKNGENIGVYYTRTTDDNPTFDQRVQLANKADANLFISIHNNSMASGRMSATSGTQVMYDELSESSKQLAQICLDEMTAELGSRDRGLVKGNSIYIIRTSEVPVALIEVGFMTNEEELALLKTEEYQRTAAQGVYRAIHKAFEEGY